MNGRIVLFSLISSFLVLTLVMAASAQTRIVGVDIGNKFRYSVTASWISDDPNATAPFYLVDYKDTEWLEINITAISGRNITGQNTKHYWNGTETAVDSWVDVDTGTGSLTSFFISANLTVGDTMYNSSYFPQFINETVPRTYLDTVRDTNHIRTTSDGISNTNYSMYWGKLTGVLVDMLVENTYQTDAYTTSWSVEFQIINSDIWVVPEFPTWTSAILMIIVLTSAIIIVRLIDQRTRQMVRDCLKVRMSI
jgi:hypothetical protein